MRRQGRVKFATIAVIAGISALVAISLARLRPSDPESNLNFVLHYERPTGWVDRPMSPFTLFLWRDPKTNVTIRGAESQMVAEMNPTPELDRDGLSQQFAEVTRDNLKWQAEVLDVVEFDGGSYRLIRRDSVDRAVVTAIAVRGNTTILITMLGIGPAKSKVSEEMAVFRKMLAATSLELKAMS